MTVDLPSIVESFVNKQYNITKHAWFEMGNDEITVQMLVQALGFDVPEVIEDYPDNERGPCCLILAWTQNGRPIHACVGYGGDKPEVITTYRPDLNPLRWDSDYHSRRW